MFSYCWKCKECDYEFLEETMSENGFLVEGLFYRVTGCVGTVYNETVCEDTVRRRLGW